MIFKQLFDEQSYTYTYLLANRTGGEALLIDPVENKIPHYLRLLKELNLNLVKAIDTHCHADHLSALGTLRDSTNCITVMGNNSSVDVVSIRVDEGDKIKIGDICLEVIYTPGHTNDSYCFLTDKAIFTGDTLLIRGTGRTDFQNGDPHSAYDSLFNKILKLNDDLIVWPGHDYKGDTSSTIAEENAHNPRLQVSSAAEYAEIMNNLNLSDPKMMDEAIPANLNIGFNTTDPEILKRTVSVKKALSLLSNNEIILVDLREVFERKKVGVIPHSIHVPYTNLQNTMKTGGILNQIAKNTQKNLLFYCSYGERSALALKLMENSQISKFLHLDGVIDAWKKNGGKINST